MCADLVFSIGSTQQGGPGIETDLAALRGDPCLQGFHSAVQRLAYEMNCECECVYTLPCLPSSLY